MRKIQNSKFKIQNFLLIFLLSTLYSLLSTTLAFAAEEAEPAFSLKALIWPIINFAILVAVLVKFLAKPAKEFFRKRTEMIEKSIKEAEEAKGLAQKALNEVKERLASTDRELEEILSAAKQAGQKERETLIAEGKKLRDKILEQARVNVEFELQKAKETIKSEAALLALELAEKQIKEKLGKKEQDALIDEYIKKLEVRN